MQIVIRGEMSLAELRQAIFERFKELEDDFAIHHSRGATIYINPTNGSGGTVMARAKDGRIIEKMQCDGAYKSAARDFKL
jgi:hypothetical protein